MTNPQLTPEQQDMIDQVEATMSISDMPLSEQDKQNLVDLATGEKTIDQVIKEIEKYYKL